MSPIAAYASTVCTAICEVAKLGRRPLAHEHLAPPERAHQQPQLGRVPLAIIERRERLPGRLRLVVRMTSP